MFEHFIECDVRRDRTILSVTEESVYNKLSCMLPQNIISDSTILDLGCATAAAGHWCISNNCRSYTGVEIQNDYVKTAKQLLPNSEIIHSDIIDFLQGTDRKWEVVIAAGILHGVFNPFKVIELMDKVATNYIIIENNETYENWTPTIHFRKTNMINAGDLGNPHHGFATYVGSRAMQFIMNEYGWVGKRVYPQKLSSGIDPYHDAIKFDDKLKEHVHRYVYIFSRAKTKKQSLEYLVKENVGI